MAIDLVRTDVEHLSDILSDFRIDVAKYRLLCESSNFEKSVDDLKVVMLKKISSHAVQNYEKGPKQDGDADTCIEELQTIITKILAIQKARNLAYSTNYLQRFIFQEPAESVKKKEIVSKLSLLKQYQSRIVELAKQERTVHFELCEARIQMQKELHLCIATMGKKKRGEKTKAIKNREKKILSKIDKVNVMRKLMIAILLSESAPLTDYWLDFFPTLRETVTMDSILND